MDFRSVLSWPVVAQVVLIHAVDDMGNTALAPHIIETREQLVFAMKTAVLIVLEVIGIFELVSVDVLVGNSELADKIFGIAFVRFRNRCGIRGDGDGLLAEYAMRGPRKVSRIRPARIRYDDAPQAAEDRK